MNIKEKRTWKAILYSMIFYLSLSYVQTILRFFGNKFPQKWSNIILYGGLVLLAVMVATVFYLKRKYKSSNEEVSRDKDLRKLFLIVAIMGIVIPFLGIIEV